MEPALDEASIIPCPTSSPAQRIRALAETLVALDRLGAPRQLRSIRGAADLEFHDSKGLKHWCFDRQTPKEAGRIVALRLDKVPFIDGSKGLFAAAEGDRAVQPTIAGVTSIAGGYVAMTDGFLVQLPGSTWPREKPVLVRLKVMTEDEEWTDDVQVDSADSAGEVRALAPVIERKLKAAISNGRVLLDRLPELYPHLVIGDDAHNQIARLTGSETFFPQLLRHLQSLDQAAGKWNPGTHYAPDGVTSSPESEATLTHGNFGPLRDFPSPAGFSNDRWSFHTKLTGGNGARLYYKVKECVKDGPAGSPPVRFLRVAVGYIGPHLPTVRFR
jgi:hypothetical protein